MSNQTEPIQFTYTDEELRETFRLIKNKDNWKCPTQVTLQNLTTITEARMELWRNADRYYQSLVYFCGGAEIEVLSVDHIKVTTKGYYHYIGA